MTIRSEVLNAPQLEAVVHRVAAGDPLALAILVKRTRPLIRAMARRWLGSKEDAEEITQDVFAQVWAQASSFDPDKGSVMAWLTILTRSRSIDRLRLRRTSSVYVEGELQACDNLDPEQQLIGVQSALGLHVALTALTPLRRQVLTLLFFDGRTHEEVAQRVGIPLGTVKSHSRRAMMSLRAHILTNLK